ncbi:hypothetical protein T439DRAFT_312234 [Meredithblackwellia eburnea MCA 4105]
MTRRDRRTAVELRPLALSQSILSRQDGSANFSFGNLSVIASVTGPAEVKIRQELVDRAALEINILPLRGLAGPSSKSHETFLLSLLSPIILLSRHPRSLIQLTVQTFSAPTTAFSKQFSTDPLESALPSSSSSSLLPSSTRLTSKPRGTAKGVAEKAAMINASTLALVDAAIECKGMVFAAAVAFVPVEGVEEEEEMILDPTPEEEEEATSAHVFAFSFGVGVGGADGECVGIDSLGSFSTDQVGVPISLLFFLSCVRVALHLTVLAIRLIAL